MLISNIYVLIINIERGVDMQERISKIKKYIEENGKVTLSELEVMFPNISSMTLRRDLEKLEQLGDVVRTRGGAKSIIHLSRIKEELYSTRASESILEKNTIAKKALSLIQEGRSIFLDSGTTTMYLSQLITNQKLFISTSAPNIALECVKNPNASVYIIGGNLNRDNLSLSGVNALDFFKNINIDIAFMAASGFTGQNGFTCGNYNECEIKRHVVSKASKVVMLMDSSKIGKSMPFSFAKFSDIDVIISDEKASDEFLNEAKKYKVGVI